MLVKLGNEYYTSVNKNEIEIASSTIKSKK